MRRLLTALIAVAFGGVVTLLNVAPASALPTVIDFGTGGLGQGGTITLFSDGSLSGTGVPIGALTIANAPLNNGPYAVTGTLGFSTGGLAGADFISITGCITGLTIAGCPTPQTLLSGTITSFNTTLSSQGLISATGSDFKNDSLLADIGLSTSTPFTLFGFSVATNTLTAGSPTSAAISTDIKNTAAVPEPSTILMLGSGLVGTGFWFRRRKA